MIHPTCGAVIVLALSAVLPAQVQSETGDRPGWTLGPLKFAATMDVYYSLNFNHPGSGLNQLRNFDTEANQFSLNMAKFTVEHDPAPLGFRVDAGFGRAFEMINGSENTSALENIEQAFVTYKPETGKGFQVDLGKFVTSAGAEVIETYPNWNYSRSLLFAWAIPYYHFGLRATLPAVGPVTPGVQLVNGWNNVDDNNSAKTIGLTAAIAAGKVTWYHNFYTGVESPEHGAGRRNLYDTTVLAAFNSRTSAYLNFDYGADNGLPGRHARWTGIAGAARFELSRGLAIAPRAEWFNDSDGFSTGVAQKLKEVTLTAEYRLRQGLLGRLEYRRDWSNQPFFDRGSAPAAFRTQNTLLAGFVAYFGPEQ